VKNVDKCGCNYSHFIHFKKNITAKKGRKIPICGKIHAIHRKNLFFVDKKSGGYTLFGIKVEKIRQKV
jgi:hypothetical protein